MKALIKIIVLSFLVGFLFGWMTRCDRNPKVVPGPIQIIEKIVEQKQQAIDSEIAKSAEVEKRILPKRARVDSLKINISKEKDTCVIVAIQDTIIIEQTDIINSLDSVITSQKIAIKGLQEINSIRVDEIQLLNQEVKALKREKKGRIIGTIAVGSLWAIVSGLLIFNK